MLDRLPEWVQDVAVMAAPIVATEALTTWIPALQDRWGATAAGSVAVTLLTLAATTVTRRYGRGSRPAPGGAQPWEVGR